MINFGLIDEWAPSAGHVTTWSASTASTAAASEAPIHPVPPSHQQEEYLRSARRNEDTGFRFSRLCLISFDLEGSLDVDAMTRTINEFVGRHDTFLSYFSVEPDGQIARHVVDAEIVDFTPTQFGHFGDSQSIRDHVQAKTPGPFHWDCLTFGTIEREGNFTIYFAVDHLNSDGISQALACVDLIALYGSHISGNPHGLQPAGSYVDYCRREREGTEKLTVDDPQVSQWIELLEQNGGRLPTFPLDLGVGSEGYTRSALRTVRIMDEESAQRIEDVCRGLGAGFNSAVLAVTGMAAREFTGSDSYFGMTPKSTRTSPAEFNAVGWFTNLIPVPVDITADSTFTSVVADTQSSYERGKTLSEVSLHRIVELIPADSTVQVGTGWVVPMVSYIDVRKLPGAQMFDHINGGVFGNRGSSEEVFLWVNRFPEYTVMTLMYPGTTEADESIDRYVEKILQIFSSVATTGDYAPASVDDRNSLVGS
ncbi:condensation domain-containing protein [Williamsia maris]|uniref:Condensation domain-containing protein n=1 Tax=Williamsia maris TaxID=72806 RepID=A0ABT1HJS2_9NOCA|nr:condensation domain-containing protein [Williamsia maris]MCP2178179.1 Condensation domain-containing protein [Williamsia maris]